MPFTCMHYLTPETTVPSRLAFGVKWSSVNKPEKILSTLGQYSQTKTTSEFLELRCAMEECNLPKKGIMGDFNQYFCTEKP